MESRRVLFVAHMDQKGSDYFGFLLHFPFTQPKTDLNKLLGMMNNYLV